MTYVHIGGSVGFSFFARSSDKYTVSIMIMKIVGPLNIVILCVYNSLRMN